MPTLYSLTDEFLKQTEKKKDFLKATQHLQKQLAKAEVEPYITDSIKQLQKILIESDKKKESPAKTRTRIKKLLDDEKFKKGSTVIELPKGEGLDKKVSAKNTRLLNIFRTKKEEILKLRRYTIDSIKEYPEFIDPEKKIVQEKKRIRIIEAIFNIKKFEGKIEQLTFADFLDPKNWLEEDRELDNEVVDYHLTFKELTKFFPTKNLLINEGRVILGNKQLAFDITEIVRQSAKESYRKLLKQEGIKDRHRRVRKG